MPTWFHFGFGLLRLRLGLGLQACHPTEHLPALLPDREVPVPFVPLSHFSDNPGTFDHNDSREGDSCDVLLSQTTSGLHMENPIMRPFMETEHISVTVC